MESKLIDFGHGYMPRGFSERLASCFGLVTIDALATPIPLQKAPFECPYCRSTSGHGGENQSKIESEQGLKPTYWVHQ
jgi:hypothetical protein